MVESSGTVATSPLESDKLADTAPVAATTQEFPVRMLEISGGYKSLNHCCQCCRAWW
ncbi:MAG TPA: hypothetical protein VGJ93_05910 [Desulfuromonadaceae bacterium]|jgi:hypothetical protein